MLLLFFLLLGNNVGGDLVALGVQLVSIMNRVGTQGSHQRLHVRVRFDVGKALLGRLETTTNVQAASFGLVAWAVQKGLEVRDLLLQKLHILGLLLDQTLTVPLALQ